MGKEEAFKKQDDKERDDEEDGDGCGDEENVGEEPPPAAGGVMTSGEVDGGVGDVICLSDVGVAIEVGFGEEVVGFGEGDGVEERVGVGESPVPGVGGPEGLGGGGRRVFHGGVGEVVGGPDEEVDSEGVYEEEERGTLNAER